MDFGLGLRNALAKITNSPYLDEKTVKETIKEIQRAMISGDVNVKLVFELTKRIEKKALDKKELDGINAKEHIAKVVYDELISIMGQEYIPTINKKKILLLGLYGSGKTTSASKLGYFYKSRGLSVALVCCDTDRPAAFEQLEQNAKKAGLKFYGVKGEKDPVKILNSELYKIKEDVVIVDSAGRSAMDEVLIKQLKQINEKFKPDEKILVIGADIGQIAKNQAENFNNAIGIDGVIISKMDGSGKGGGALSAIAASNSKACFIGTGEKHDAFEAFNPKKFVGRLLGFPDFEALIEKIKQASEKIEIKKENLSLDKLTLTTFYEQLKMMKSLGPFSSIASMMGAQDIPKDALKKSETKMKQWGALISSMTKEERDEAKIIRKSKTRIERIAKGSGTTISDVKELLDNFEKMSKTFDSVKKNRGMRKQFERMMKGADPKDIEKGAFPKKLDMSILSKFKGFRK